MALEQPVRIRPKNWPDPATQQKFTNTDKPQISKRGLLQTAGIVVGILLLICVGLSLFLAVFYNPDHIRLAPGVYQTTYEVCATKNLEHYDLLTHLIDIDDQKALERIKKDGSVRVLPAGTKVDVMRQRFGTNAVAFRIFGESKVYWGEAGAFKKRQVGTP
jgi:hypothetical protein